MRTSLEDNGIEIDSTHNEGKSVALERFNRTLKNKFCKYMTSKSKNVYIHNLDDIVDQYSDRYQQNQNKPCLCEVCNTFIDFDRNNDTKDPKFNVGDHVRISKNISTKGCIPNWSEEFCVIIYCLKDTV